ncbi:MAG: IclR family transcriptional regulator [Lautropia sp.]
MANPADRAGRTGTLPTGTQSIERAALILRALAERRSIGWRALDLAAHCSLDRGTTHRILACLVRERLVRQRASDKRYVPGPLLFELGLSVSGFTELQTVCHAPLARLARRLGASALLYLRSGAEFVCAARVEFTPLKALTIDVGTRRPLIVSAGAVAMLLALPQHEADAMIAANLRDVAHLGSARIAALQRMLRRSRRLGVGVSQDDIVPNISAFGVAIHDGSGAPFASISVVSTTDQLPEARVPEVVAALNGEARRIEREILQGAGGHG